MTPRAVKQARAHETRSRILVGAAASFAEHGFAGATISDIMERSGVTKGALYFHFDTKEEVADAVLDAHAQWLASVVAGLEGPAAQRLIDFGYVACEGLTDDPIFQATARLAVERETYGPGRPASFGLWEDVAVRLLEDIKVEGGLRAGIETRALARMLSSGMLGTHLAARAGGPQANLHDDVTAFWIVVGPCFLTPDAMANLRIDPRALATV